MYLTQYNSVLEASEWLSENTHERWTWKDVLRIFTKLNIDTVSVNVPSSAWLYQLSATGRDQCKFDNIKRFEVQGLADFLHRILMGDSLETACANPHALVFGGARYCLDTPIPASAIRLTKNEIYRLADHSPLESFPALVSELRDGKYLELAELARASSATVETAAERRSKYDAARDRGARRRILEQWNDIERIHGKHADAYQVLRMLKLDKEATQPVLKTVRNTLIELRKEGLIP